LLTHSDTLRYKHIGMRFTVKRNSVANLYVSV